MTGSRGRRSLVRTACVVLVGSVAGCVGDDPATGGTDGSAATTGPLGTTDPPAATGPTDATATGGQPTVEAFLSRTDNFDGVEDRTGTDAVGVDVGVEANGAFFGFGPPAVRVDRGTAVTWTWTGQGGTHNVVARHGADFESDVTSEEGHTVRRTFDESGTVLYACAPHEGAGMRGAVVVE